MSLKVPNQFRVRTGFMASDNDIGNNVAFEVKLPREPEGEGSQDDNEEAE